MLTPSSVRINGNNLLRTIRQQRCLSSGESISSIKLRHSTPSDTLALPTSGRQIIVGVPAAFSPGCSNSHIPGYISKVNEFKKAGVDGIYVVSVNDVFVMNAWSNSFSSNSTADVLATDGNKDSYIKFLADHDGSWTKDSKVDFDASGILGSVRSKRFAAIVNNGNVEKAFVEKDNTGISISAAEK